MKNIFDNFYFFTDTSRRLITAKMSQSLTITREFSEYLRQIISHGLTGIFRRFDCLTSNTKPLSIRKHFAPGQYEELNMPQLQSMSSEDVDRFVEVTYSSFHGFTTTQQIREEPEEIMGRPIFINSNNYGQFNFSTLEFEKTAHVTPYSSGTNGDLLFIFMSSETLKNCRGKDYNYTPRADCWGIVSEQFLRTWTLITHEWHETFDKLIPKNTPFAKKEQALKGSIFSGNRTMTNCSLLKPKLALEEAGKNMSIEEEKEKYRHLRTEEMSRNYVHFYSALVSMVRYGELPCPSNVPNNKKNASSTEELFTLSSWNLPEKFVTKILSLVQKKWFYPTTVSEYMFFGHISDAISNNMYNVKNYVKNVEVWKPKSQAKYFLSDINKIGFVDEIARLKLPKEVPVIQPVKVIPEVIKKEEVIIQPIKEEQSFEKKSVNKCNELQEFLKLMKQKTVSSPVKQTKNVNITIAVEINKKPTARDLLFEEAWY